MKYYSANDFYNVEKIDAHIHINTNRKNLGELAGKDNFIFISINVDAFPDFSIEKQQEHSVKQHEFFPDRFFHLTTFRAKGFEQPGWEESVLSYLRKSVAKGAVGVKVWKNIGMDEKTRDGRYIMIDDPLFDNIFSFMEEHNIPLTGHLGEPRSCWLPMEKIIMPGDIDYFGKNPEYHMYLHPECPAYEMHIQATENLLNKHPRLVYVGAHLASLEWDVDELARRFDAFPLMSADLTERICYLQYQSVSDWAKVYDFVMKYQDRLLYGTDIISDGTMDTVEEDKHAHDLWVRDWIYFTQDGIMTTPGMDLEFRGLKLPRSVVDKIFSKNARRVYLNKHKQL
jgi:predicted TIM-barrel fold metal-dependent hydrolase